LAYRKLGVPAQKFRARKLLSAPSRENGEDTGLSPVFSISWERIPQLKAASHKVNLRDCRYFLLSVLPEEEGFEVSLEDALLPVEGFVSPAFDSGFDSDDELVSLVPLFAAPPPPFLA
jgi:hypothetical protein